MREAALLLVLLVANPLGLVSGTDELSQQTFLLLAAPFYRLNASYELCPSRFPFPFFLFPFPFLCVKHDAAAPITVIMIDEQTLATAESGYPLDDPSLTTLITTVTNHCAALFVDLILGDPRPGERPLPEDLRRALSQEAPKAKDCPHKTPVYLADIPPGAEPGEASTEGAAEKAAEPAGGSDEPDDGDSHLVHASLREGSLRLPVRWKQPGYAYPVSVKRPPRLPLGPEARGGRWVSDGEELLPSPALQLYRDLRGDRAVQDLPKVMAVGWGWKQPRLDDWYDELVSERAQDHPCFCRPARPDQRPYDETYAKRWAWALLTTVEELSLRVFSPAGRWCGIERGDPAQPYYFPLTISGASFLLRPGADEADRHEKILRHALKGRAVLIGQNATAASDRIVSPVHGVVPGVILHAQALDNLLLWNSRVWQSWNGGDLDPENKWMSNERWATFGVIMLLSILMTFLREVCEWGRWWAFLTACIVGIWLSSSAVLLSCLAPINWIGLIVFLLWETLLRLLREDEPEAVEYS